MCSDEMNKFISLLAHSYNMSKNIDLQNKTNEEMSTMLKDLKSKLLQFNFELGEKRLKNFSQIKKTKKEIARILTVVNKKNGK